MHLGNALKSFTLILYKLISIYTETNYKSASDNIDVNVKMRKSHCTVPGVYCSLGVTTLGPTQDHTSADR